MNADTPGPVLEARCLRREFEEGGRRLEVLGGVDLAVDRGERVAIIGKSGTGKSTLLHLLGGLDRPSAGSVHVAGENLFELPDPARSRLRNSSIGFVYQFHHLLADFTALENVMMPMMIGRRPRAEADGRARALLAEVGLEDRLTHRPGQLSGGERQRVAMARALVMEPRIVLADEPTGNLDESTAEQVNALMIALSDAHGIAFVVVTHSPPLASRMDRTLRLHNGRLEGDAT